jgi:ArsR family transcriptional regulator
MARKVSFADDVVNDLAQAFRLLSDETRLRIVFHLAREEQNVGGLCKILGLAQPTVSHHLGLLRMGRLILNRRNGKQVIYSLNADMLSRVSGQLTSCVPDLTSMLKGRK